MFPFFYHLSLFSFYSRVCLSFKLPFSILCSLASIAFLLALLGCLLKSIEGECLKWVNLFVGEDCPYKFVLFLLFPLVSHSAKVARLVKMSEVRSSDLEMGLSSSNDRVILEATSPSTPYKV